MSEMIHDKSQLSLALEYLDRQHAGNLRQLLELLRFPTIAAEYPENAAAFQGCTNWLVEKLSGMGFEYAEGIPVQDAPPVVYAEWSGAGTEAPTLLIYGHYDVMPVDPLEEWKHSPFEPYLDEQRIYGRGASDDKGQFMAVLYAAEAWLKGTGSLPVNLKVVLEGEEEQISPHLDEYLQVHRGRLQCDGILIADMGGLDPQVPLVMYGVRGNCSLEIHVSGPARDLHSGTYGGGVDNPLNVLVRLLAALQDGASRKVLVPGFYDRVKELTPRELALAEVVPITDEAGVYFTGVPALGGEPGIPLKLRLSSRPTFEVHGIVGGYTGEGVKTVIPAHASAKISFRLVPDQQPEEIQWLVKAYLESIAPPTVRLEVKTLGLAPPATVDLDAPVVQASLKAFRNSFGVAPCFVRGGGSLPILLSMQKLLNQDVLLTGFGLPEDAEHSPNESFSIQQFQRGAAMMVHYFFELSQVMK